MVLNDLLKIAIEEQWQQHTGHVIKIKQARRVYGGDINNSFHLTIGSGDFFLKYNEQEGAGDWYKKETDGLKLLLNTQTISVPKPLFYSSTGKGNFMVMEFIQKSPPQLKFWEIFAEKLAAMHRCSSPHFGLQEDNYIGPLLQINRFQDTWPVFYARQRIEPLVRKCVDKGNLLTGILKNCERLYTLLPEIFPEEVPALVHGDLWGGNYLPGPGGVPFIFDPAVYYGNREMDLAMTRLFGGFDRKFYWYYEDYFPLSSGWQERITLCQLYPLLVHALLFGGGYVQQVRNILSMY